jgi:molybdopterin/thiamine biosynthesis adenylyltransferase
MISLEAQKRIQSSTVAIAGVGGIGGAVAMMCAKAGFGHLILCDHDQYEMVNIVEQMFATRTTVGEDKTSAAAHEIRRHNPGCKVTTIQREIRCQKDAEAVVRRANYLVSAVDNPFARILLARSSRACRIPLFVPANVGWTVLFEIFLPSSRPYEEHLLTLPKVKVRRGMLDLADARTREMVQADWDIWVALLASYEELVTAAVLSGGVRSYSYMAPPAFFAASFGVSQLIKWVAQGEADYIAPRVYCYDLRKCRDLGWQGLLQQQRKLIREFAQGGPNRVLTVWRSRRKQTETN